MAHWMDLNLKILNLLTPYHCERKAHGYRFVTDFGFIYDLTFLKYPTLNERSEYILYMFNIEQVKKGKTSTDVKIQITIEYILTLFFENNTDAVVVVMDSSDGKHLVRKRLFDKWYYQPRKLSIEKYEASCNTEELEIVTTLFVEKNNPYKNIILSDYYELVKLNFYS
jgi:hypothetical protein